MIKKVECFILWLSRCSQLIGHPIFNEQVLPDIGKSLDLIILETKTGIPAGLDESPYGGWSNTSPKRIVANA
jgi:hypothetical protein